MIQIRSTYSIWLMLFKFFSFMDFYSPPFFCFCHSFVEETSPLSCRVSHIPDSANCIPLVFLNLFLCPFISYIQVVSSGGLSRIRFDFLTKSLELLRQRNEVTKRARVVALGKNTLRWHPLGSQVGDRKNRAPQTSIGLASGMLSCWWGSLPVSSRLISSHLTLHEGSLGPNDPTSWSVGAGQQLALMASGRPQLSPLMVLQ